MASDSPASANSGSALCSIHEFLAQDYDYVVVGGGTAGLCIAARLTENPDVVVGVLEAGENRMDDKRISTPALFPTLLGREEYDWCFQTVPQKDAGSKTYSMPRGRVLGGSSAINYLMYVRGSRADYDAWRDLGNEGWGWDDLAPYFRKHQTLDPPENAHPDPQFMPHAATDKYHGTDGPIHTSFNDFYFPFEEDFVKAAYEVTGGKNTLHDAWSGDHLGFYSSLGAVNRTTDPGKRSYAATGYLKPNLDRPNLKVLTAAHASKIILEGKRAVGVEFLHGGEKHSVKASKEVILCAGAIQSPQLLELSGIGDKDVLNQAGIDCIVENKGVGNNFQDHVLGGMVYDLADGVLSFDALHGAEYAKAQEEAYEKGNNGMLASPGMLMGFVSYASLVSKEKLDSTIAEIRRTSLATTDFEKRQEETIISQLADPTFANLQTFCIPCSGDLTAGSDQRRFLGPPPEGKNRVSLLMCLEHPFSRGSVHITSPDPLAAPRIDTGYFRQRADASILAEGIAWLDRVARRPVLARNIAARVQPPPGPSDKSNSDSSTSSPPSSSTTHAIDTEDQRVAYVRDHITTQYHLIGTCAMGEVVDSTLKVRGGVEGLRVVDASVFPGHVSGNIMASTYAVAEKGADLIKADDGRFALERMDSVLDEKKTA